MSNLVYFAAGDKIAVCEPVGLLVVMEVMKEHRESEGLQLRR